MERERGSVTACTLKTVPNIAPSSRMPVPMRRRVNILLSYTVAISRVKGGGDGATR